MARTRKVRRKRNTRMRKVRRKRRLTRRQRARLRALLRRARRRRKYFGRCRLISRPFLIRHRSSSTGEKVDRLATVVSAAGEPTAFYQSTGTGSPGVVKAKTWVPFGGISRTGGGWFIKTPGKVPTGDLKTCSDWLARRKLRPTKIFDQADYEDKTAHSADVNAHLDRHGALSREPGRFQIGTVNVRKK